MTRHQPTSPTWRTLLRLAAHGLAAASLAALAVGCAASDDLGGSGAVPQANGGGDNDGGAGPGVNNGDGGNNAARNNAPANNDPFVPEPEEDFDFRAPRSTRNFVFVANTSLDAVAKVDATTLEITSIEVGDRPTLVEAYKPDNMAVVLSEGSSEASVIRAGDVNDYVVHLDLPPGLNGLAIAPNGDYALAWFDFDAALADPETTIGDSPPFQELAVIKLEEGAEEVFRLTVGFQVLDVDFDDAGDKAYVVTRTGVSVVDLEETDGDAAVPPVPIADVGIEDELEREVEVTGDGRFAFVRSGGPGGRQHRRPGVDADQPGVAGRRAHRPGHRARGEPGAGRGAPDQPARHDRPARLPRRPRRRRHHRARRRARRAGRADAGRHPRPGLHRRRGAPGHHRGGPGRRRLRRLPPAKGRQGRRRGALGRRGRRLPLQAARGAGAGGAQDEFIARSWGYSLFDIETGFAKLETVPSEPGEFIFTDEGGERRLFVLLNDTTKNVRQVEIINMRALSARSLRLGSPPEHIGVIPNDGDPRIYISQEHPVGRMTFIFDGAEEVRTVTGYQLNSLIE